ncbi:MAG TPA: outer membrane beta-barrel protein [Cyclobacteriaceae bacterium]|jgi:hypothetical protein|nr:outer membrane beta-barrel protein [Cyclobacteriaceae bacterium]
MKYFLFLLFLCFIGLNVSVAQQSGAQTLRLAQSIYEQGRLHEIPDLINKNIAGFSKTELVSAYRLLTLSYIYLEEPEKADESMQKLLQTEHFFEPNPNVEPAEFIGLYKTFRTKAVFNAGIKFGANFTTPLLNEIYYVTNAAPGNGKYTPKLGFQAGLVFEKDLLPNSKSSFLSKIVFAPEVLYTSRTFSYDNKQVFTSDSVSSANVADQKITLKQTWLDINLVFQYKLRNSTTFVPYVGFGPGVGLLLGASNTMVTTRTSVNKTSPGVSSGPDVTTKDTFNSLIPSIMGSAGVKYRLGGVYVVGEFRVQYALVTPVNSAKRTGMGGSASSSVFDYGYTMPNYKPLNFVINAGIIIPYFNPIKIKRK